MKYLKVNLVKTEQDLHTENSKICTEKEGKDLNKWSGMFMSQKIVFLSCQEPSN